MPILHRFLGHLLLTIFFIFPIPQTSIIVSLLSYLYFFQVIYCCPLFLASICFSGHLFLSFIFFILLFSRHLLLSIFFYLLPFCKKNNRKSSGLFSARIRFWDIYPHLHFLTPSDPLLPSIPSLFQIPTNFYKHISLVFHTASLYFFALLQSSFLGIFCLPKTI